ncbi:hypothetical protein [Arthrobacter sp. B3I4]|uniref:hypothetical protein n=1 Tax=Arthrobacter sp. B3I4 TaxID=3042267 RepID=UPI00278AC9D0|nr:hypothetical protein [Arthrobacter sp. B3I4]MDQ0756580.1 hypothetical protein [Arthrobacter sp. B3I4]
MSKPYDAARRVESDNPDAVQIAVREATQELRQNLERDGIDVSFQDLALLGHSESWDGEGQRWVHVTWEGAEAG